MQEKYTIGDFYFWKITISLAFASFFVFAAMYVVQPLLPVFVEEFGISINTASYSLSLTIIGLIIGLILLGFFSDRIGRTIFIKFSLIGSVIPFFLLPLIDSFWFILVGRLVQGFALAGLPAASIAYLNEEMDRRSVGVATALYISSNALGGMAGRVITGYIADQYSWENAFYFFGILGFVLIFAVLFTLPKSHNFEPTNETFRKDIEGFFFHLKNPSLVLVIGMGIVLQLSFTGIWTYLPFHLEGEPFTLSLEAISYMYFAYALGIVGSPIAGWFSGRFGLNSVRNAGIFTMVVGIFATFSQSLVVIIIGLCVLCLGFFMAHSLTATSVGEKATHHKGSASSLYLVAYYIGVTLGSSAISPVWEGAGWHGVLLLTGILPIAYLLFVNLMLRRVRGHRGS
ncbi:MFS transporter [Oceanobacillus piezotolerans]|uniref:MFS transporter n=1 Tax=Oceanobacillus piezotolerans TaxID=2448030 RepID=A0A498DJN6_9BACI|nr:MFS transporter [Oceanobacillus piezotolerans]RLL46682.1 MFS transporter [Oceanobacillus piezotolerans]